MLSLSNCKQVLRFNSIKHDGQDDSQAFQFQRSMSQQVLTLLMRNLVVDWLSGVSELHVYHVVEFLMRITASGIRRLTGLKVA